jgi:hypothetical protein
MGLECLPIWRSSYRNGSTRYYTLTCPSELCHEDVWGSGDIAPASLISELDGAEFSALRLGRFTPREKAPGTDWLGGWVSTCAGLDAEVKRKILHCPEYPGRPSCRHTDWATTTPSKYYNLWFTRSIRRKTWNKFLHTPLYIPTRDVNYFRHSWVWNPVGRTHDLKAFPAINTHPSQPYLIYNIELVNLAVTLSTRIWEDYLCISGGTKKL